MTLNRSAFKDLCRIGDMLLRDYEKPKLSHTYSDLNYVRAQEPNFTKLDSLIPANS